MDWQGKPYYSLDAYFKHTYGQKIYKIAVDAGLTCPNRDGTLDTRGCTFCSAGGSGDFAVKIGTCNLQIDNLQEEKLTHFEHRNRAIEQVYHKEYENKNIKGNGVVNDRVTVRKCLDVERQIERGMAKFNKRVGERFVIYFQAYTNTYGDVNYLKQIWKNALEHEKVVGISIATRPDCLSDEVILILEELQKEFSKQEKFIWIELGLQTKHEKTAIAIRRHYTLEQYEEAIRKLEGIGVPYIVHIILGLPGETKEDMLETVSYVCDNSYKPQGIKLQLLHVLEHTDLAKQYEQGEFEVLSMEKYFEIVSECLKIIPKDIVMHRLTGDGPKNILIAPTWSGNKKHVLNSFHKYLADMNVVQGLNMISE